MKKQYILAVILLAVLFLFDGFIAKNSSFRNRKISGNPAPNELNADKIKKVELLPVKSTNSDYHDPGFKKIVQVAFVVKDIEASSRRWAELLGQPVPKINTTRPGHEVKEIYRGQPSEGQVKLTFFNLGQVVIELLQPVSPGTSWYEFLQKRGEGVQHLGFQIEDPAMTSAELEKLGYPIFHRGRYDGDNGDYIYHDTLDSLGVVIELLHSDGK
jgi:methylmalonyl-CoA/ethylmalonyl-CoA epimerase